jgi:hypothetical protein
VIVNMHGGTTIKIIILWLAVRKFRYHRISDVIVDVVVTGFECVRKLCSYFKEVAGVSCGFKTFAVLL